MFLEMLDANQHTAIAGEFFFLPKNIYPAVDLPGMSWVHLKDVMISDTGIGALENTEMKTCMFFQRKLQ